MNYQAYTIYKGVKYRLGSGNSEQEAREGASYVAKVLNYTDKIFVVGPGVFFVKDYQDLESAMGL